MMNLEEEEKHHIEKLSKLCRLCGNNIKATGRKPKEVASFSTILKDLDIDIDGDSYQIHPTKLCEKCRKICVKIESFKLKSETMVYKPQIELFNFIPHCKQSCQICSSGKLAGRNKK